MMNIKKLITSILALLFLFLYIFNIPITIPALFLKNNYILLIPEYKLTKNNFNTVINISSTNDNVINNSTKENNNNNKNNNKNKNKDKDKDKNNQNKNNKDNNKINLNKLTNFLNEQIDYNVIFNILKKNKSVLLVTYNGFLKLKYKKIKTKENLKNILSRYILQYVSNNFNYDNKNNFNYDNKENNFLLSAIFPQTITKEILLPLNNFHFYNRFTILSPYFLTNEEMQNIENFSKIFKKNITIKYLFNDTNLSNFSKYYSFLDNVSYTFNSFQKTNYVTIYFSKNWISTYFGKEQNLSFKDFQFLIDLSYFYQNNSYNFYKPFKSLKVNLNSLIQNDYKMKILIPSKYQNVLFNIKLKSEQKNDIVFETYFKIIFPESKKNNILFVSQNYKYNFFDNFFKMDKIDINNLLNKDLTSYNLIILDGINIKQLNRDISNIFYSLYENGLTSFMFISNGKFLGKEKDNTLIENILPVILKPRSLKYLPPINIALLLDISSSMLGQKLSLAKVSLLEFIKNLKDQDLITIVLFWDKYKLLFEHLTKNQIIKSFNIEEIKAQGGTDLYTPLLKIINQYSINDDKDKHIIVISDGFTKKADFDNLIYRTKLKNITITTIGIGDKINFQLLSKLSSQTSGNFYQVNSFDAIPKVILEDRKKISRSNFANNKFNIYDFNNDYISYITGMNFYTPKDQSIVIFQNEFNDPLLIYKKYKNRFQILFSSDIYGKYTNIFFNNNFVKNSFLKILDNLNKNRNIPVSISEHFKEITISLKREFLYSPEVIIYKDNKEIKRVKLNKYNLNYYNKNIFMEKPGKYLIAVNDKNENILKYEIYFNNNFSGITQPMVNNYLKSNKTFFVNIADSKYWLIFFFLLSLYLTVLNRNIKINKSKH